MGETDQMWRETSLGVWERRDTARGIRLYATELSRAWAFAVQDGRGTVLAHGCGCATAAAAMAQADKAV